MHAHLMIWCDGGVWWQGMLSGDEWNQNANDFINLTRKLIMNRNK